MINNIVSQNEVIILEGKNKGRIGYVRCVFPTTKEAKIYCWDGLKIYESVSNLKKLRDNAFIPDS